METENSLNAELDFEKKIDGMDLTALVKFTARQVYDVRAEQSKVAAVCAQIPDHETRLKSLESGNKKVSAVSGGVSGAVIGVVVGLVEYFTKRPVG